MSTATGKKRKALVAGFVMLFMISFSPCPGAAAVAPEVTHLLTLRNLSFPGKIASDHSGNLLVADTYYKRIGVYSPNGTRKATIQLAYKPTALAVSPDGLLYVAEVKAYYSGCIEVFDLGTFSRLRTSDIETPASMAFLSSGEIFIVSAYQVKKLDASLNTILAFGGYGTGNGQFIEPSAVAVNEQRNELYVLDKGALATEGGYANTYVWRVQVFNLTGGFLRSFSNYGYGVEGRIGSASGMALDKQGRVYISDNVQGITGVFDEYGAYLMSIFGSDEPVGNPVNIYYANDRLYVASKLDSSAAVFGIDDYALLSVAPPSLNISSPKGAGGASGSLTIANAGKGPLGWQASPDVHWLALSQSAGDVAALGGQEITVSADTTGFSAGSTYTGNIHISSNGGVETVGVQVTVYESPVLSVTPLELNLTKKTNETISPVEVNISISNEISEGSTMWHASSDAEWLSLAPQDGITNTVPAPSIRVADNVSAGSYVGHVTVSADGAIGSPAIITVNLEVIAANKIFVTTNNADASFQITGPSETYTGTGTGHMVEGVQAGEYTITFNALSGFKTPATITQNLADGGELVVYGEYVDLRRQMNIIASREPEGQNRSDVGILTANGTRLFAFRPFNFAYGASTAEGDVDGDGVDDIIVGAGPGSDVPGAISGFRGNGEPIQGLSLIAFSNGGVEVGVADLDGDGKGEIIAGNATNSSRVSVYSYREGAVSDTGASIDAYPGGSGVNVAAADVDGDGLVEIVTSPKNGSSASEIRLYRVSTSTQLGNWSVANIGGFYACDGAEATAMTVGDIDGEGRPEVLVVCAKEAGTEVIAYDSAGAVVRSLPAGSGNRLNIAAGDVNMDGAAEVILGDGSPGRNVRILDGYGAQLNSFEAFTDGSGVRVSAGMWNYETIFGAMSYALISANPLTTEISYQKVSMSAPSQEITISNSGNARLTWQASADAAWLAISQGSGEIEAGGSQTITAAVDADGLDAGGVYTGNISVLSNGGAEALTLTVTVFAPPILGADPAQLSVQQDAYRPAPVQEVNISLTDDMSGAMTWQASSDSSWLSIEPSSGSSNETTAARVLISSDLPPGRYDGRISVASAGGQPAPVTISVGLDVLPSGKITVTTNIPEAIFSVAGPSGSFSGTGMYSEFGRLEDGVYVVTFDPLRGYKAPVSMSQEIVRGEEINFAGVYTENRVMVTTNVADARFTVSGPDGASQGSGTVFVLERAPEGVYSVTFDAVKGFKTPPAMSLSLDQESELVFVGDYEDLRKQMNIIAGRGPGQLQPAEIEIFTVDGVAAQQVATALPNAYGATAVAGDVDGDGIPEIVSGAGTGSKNPAKVVVTRLDGEIAAEFNAFPEAKFGVEVATGDLDGDGVDEIIAGMTKDASTVRIFQTALSDAGSMTISYTGVEFEPYSGGSGVMLAAGDIDGDGRVELVTTPGEGGNDRNGPVARVYRITYSDNWVLEPVASFQTCDNPGSTNLSAGDIDADAISEVMVVCAAKTGTKVKIFRGDGTFVSDIPTGSTVRDYVAAGDTNMDGTAEIIIGDGASSLRNKVKVFDAGGTLLYGFDAFTDSFGVRVSVGDFGY